MAPANKTYRILGVNSLHVLTDGGASITATALAFVNQVNFNSDIGTVDFQGDQQQERVYIDNGFTVEATCDKYDLKGISTAFGKSVVSPAAAGVAERTYFGETAQTAGVSVGVRATCSAVDSVSGATKTIRIEVPVATLSVVEPPNLSYNGKGQMRLRFTATKTAVDIAGDALNGVPSGGATWFLDELS